MSATREMMSRHFESEERDGRILANDVIFALLATGDTARGPEAVIDMLDHIYHDAFDAHAEPRNTLIVDGHAVWEGHLVGKHTGEFAGIPATGKDVCVPLCVVYDLQDDEIRRARIYLEMTVLRQQLGLEGPVREDC
jgi:steroid delta-isomerase-like uncharacterized protein